MKRTALILFAATALGCGQGDRCSEMAYERCQMVPTASRSSCMLGSNALCKQDPQDFRRVLDGLLRNRESAADQ